MNPPKAAVAICANFLWNESKHAQALKPQSKGAPGKLPSLAQIRFDRASGDTVAMIARRYGVKWEEIDKALGMRASSPISAME